MTNLTLIPVIEPSAEEIASVSNDTLDRVENMFATAALSSKFAASVAKANVLVDGQIITSVALEDVEFIVSARYRQNGDLWVRGEGFELNISNLIRRMRPLIS